MKSRVPLLISLPRLSYSQTLAPTIFQRSTASAFVSQLSNNKQITITVKTMSSLSSPSGTVAKPHTSKRHCTTQEGSDGEHSRTGSSRLLVSCPVCHGEGQIISRKRRTKKQKRAYQNAKDNGLSLPPPPPIKMPCKECSGSGIRPIGSVEVDQLPRVVDNVHIGIIGGGTHTHIRFYADFQRIP